MKQKGDEYKITAVVPFKMFKGVNGKRINDDTSFSNIRYFIIFSIILCIKTKTSCF